MNLPNALDRLWNTIRRQHNAKTTEDSLQMEPPHVGCYEARRTGVWRSRMNRKS